MLYSGLLLCSRILFSFDFSRFQVEDPSIPQSQSVLASYSLSALYCATKREAAAMAAAQVAFVLQSGQHRGVQFTIASGPAVTLLSQNHETL
ncbi:hypothetical protein Q3G72_001551 [Acer saccharum]|nr:hypothetical protein Q3G72_001551 [Acer saccharum]